MKPVVNQHIEFAAVGPRHRTGTGIVGDIVPIATADGVEHNIYAVYSDAPIPEEEPMRRWIWLGEGEITAILPNQSFVQKADELA